MAKRFNNKLTGGTLLLFSVLITNVINMIYSVFLSRVLTFEEFGILTVFNTFSVIALIPFTAFQSTIIHRVAYLTGKNKYTFADEFIRVTKKYAIKITLFASFFWILLSVFINNIFKINNIFVPLLFTPILIFGVLLAFNKGYLQGKLNFYFVSLLVLIEPISKFLYSFILYAGALNQWIFVSIPLSIGTGYGLSVLLTPRTNTKETTKKTVFPKKFFWAALISGISSMAFFTMDVLLAKHFLSPTEAGQYAFLSLVGKMVYFFGILPSYLILTFVSNDLGNKSNPRIIFYRLLFAAIILTVSAFIFVAPLGKFFLPLIFGQKVFAILPYLNTYSSGIAFLTIATTITSYHLAKKQYFFPIISIFMAAFMSVGIIIFHNGIYDITQVIFAVSLLNLTITSLLHVFETTHFFSFKRRVAAI